MINIQFPEGFDFDEFHYVPSARQVLQRIETQNWEHPPLAKEIIALGMWLFGDRPIGWRFMSTVFGSFTLVAMYLWALTLFRDRKIALWVALLTIVNQLLYVQARIGMLDTFMVAFIIAAMASFTASWNVPEPLPAEADVLQRFFRGRNLLYMTGFFLGLATCCKWFAIIPWALCVALVALVHLFRHWNVNFGPSESEEPEKDDWYNPNLWKGIRVLDWLLAFGVIPVVVYYIPFVQFFFLKNANHGILDVLFTMQYKMWDGQGRVVSSHPYMSHWMDWPTMHRPIWYVFDKSGAPPNEMVRGVLLLGNPIIMWAGLVALVPCLWGWLVERRRDAFIIVASYVAFFFSWLVIPRKIEFFYYYYPAGMVLSLALGYVFFHGEKDTRIFPLQWGRWVFLAVSLIFFIYFFPISAALKIPAESFRAWMWFPNWI